MTRPYTILVAALGGEGGGVLADWLIEAALYEGFPAQKTSIPGVSQRTGATTYYVEIFPEKGARPPVMALVPSPGGIDLMAASELVEAGRAMQNAFITPERTTLVASTHRVYATSEKMLPTDGRYDAQKILEAAPKVAQKAVLFDMSRMARGAGTVINAVLFGAMAGSGALPLSREACEQAIRGAGKGAEASLRGFAAGHARAAGEKAPAAAPPPAVPPATASERVRREFPIPLRALLDEAVARLADYQDPAYAALYLDRVRGVLAVDREAGGEPGGWPLTREAARLLALWMSYEDVIRVADLKTRASRFDRVRKEAAAKDGQIVVVTDYLKPSANEIADILPPAWAERLRRKAGPGRAVKLPTSAVSGFLAMRLLATLKPLRRRSARFREEQALIERWLGAIKRLGFAALDAGLALEIAQCARLVRGYGETQRRSREAFVRILDELVENEQSVARGAEALALAIRRAREAALVYEECQPAPAARAKPVIWMKQG
ncbi:MAG: indolepyruvate oxidoreductase subunit B [Rhodocyclaceae bacterium]|nr:indolepyruvate oxidoreductase subunit B [Rhodocyclaceae bacterium]HNQ56454.1 indolepyruvate oxidoreductase subunit beta family protein [Candidatus Desulfobacillus denitrificans]HNT62841.1 indolepyruvate oxidoreductase subunit beta family protein [Candidatus Desulfobacillus denitrificans]